jgi:nicotinate-nucleotide adenylyltransferase
MRIGVFGGSFDPVHLGHLLLAEACRESAGLDLVLFVPAAASPLKTRTLTADKHRVTMLQLASGGHEAFRVDERELARGGVSYTVDTLRALSAEFPHDELWLLIGADALRDFPRWREPAEICRLASLLAVRRGGLPPLDFAVLEGIVSPERRAQFAAAQVAMPLIELSSSDLRARAAAGRSLRFRVPRAVEEYIRQHALYAAGPTAS